MGLYSLLGTCRLNKVNPWEWLSDVLVRVNVRSDDTAVSLLPINWKNKPVGQWTDTDGHKRQTEVVEFF